ncbi:MAG: N-methyl-L-tryptophan oxidase, partial [Gemmatimonadales bacterium]|nr:N-methyl-L-tryptophan oxidase [Gemmatimonadales bacterium]
GSRRGSRCGSSWRSSATSSTATVTSACRVAAAPHVLVVGLGAAGSAAALTLARRGIRVTGLDRFRPPHPHGSSHGRSRVIREAYYESPVYVPLIRRAYELWQALERDGGRPLLRPTGGLMLGPEGGPLVRGARHSAVEHGLPFELLDAATIRRRFPAFHAPAGTVGVLEPRAGFLDPEAAIETSLTLAARAGADLRFDVAVAGWRATASGIALDTSAGLLEADRVILTAGAWAPALLAGASVPLSVERQVMYWFAPARPEGFAAGTLPVFIWEWEPGRLFYGIPDHGAGFKVAQHHGGEATTADTVRRRVLPEEVAGMRQLLRRFLPDADGPPTDAVTCLYTNTPDHHFVLGAHPGDPRVILGSACSGHGFKFATVLGEVLADLALTGRSSFDLTPFRPGRFG